MAYAGGYEGGYGGDGITNASIIHAIRLHLESAEPRLRPFVTALTNSPSTTGTTFSVGDGDAFQVGDQVETGTGELALVTAISTNDLTVTRIIGQTAAEDLSSGDVLRKNPRFSADQITQEISTSLRELRGNGIYALLTETITFTTDEWYDVTDTSMETVVTAWYIDDDRPHVPFFTFVTDPANTQPKVYIAAAGFTGDVFIAYKDEYTTVLALPSRLADLIINLATYKLLGASMVMSTTDPSRRVDRNTQGGQEGRDSVWFLREFIRLRDLEVARLERDLKNLPKDGKSQRARRFQK